MKETMITASIAAVLSLALVACGGSGTEATTTEDTQAEAAAAGSAAATEGTALVTVNTEGFGVIALAEGDEELEFDDEFPMQSAGANAAVGSTIRMEARDYAEYEGWHFVKWTRDGEDFSTDNLIECVVDGDADFVAVFEMGE